MAYYHSVLDHYPMAGDHFKNIPAYANYAVGSAALKAAQPKVHFPLFRTTTCRSRAMLR